MSRDSLTSEDLEINSKFEKEWSIYLKHGACIPNDAWVKELTRTFFGLGHFANCTKDEVKEQW